MSSWLPCHQPQTVGASWLSNWLLFPSINVALLLGNPNQTKDAKYPLTSSIQARVREQTNSYTPKSRYTKGNCAANSLASFLCCHTVRQLGIEMCWNQHWNKENWHWNGEPSTCLNDTLKIVLQVIWPFKNAYIRGGGAVWFGHPLWSDLIGWIGHQSEFRCSWSLPDILHHIEPVI